MLHSAFTLAKMVHEGSLTQTEAAHRLNAQHGVNVNSAKIMVTVYGRLVRGLVFKRALNASDMRYYLAQFFAEGGVNALSNPLTALWMHIEYYEDKNNVNLKALREVASHFNALLHSGTSFEVITQNFNESVQESLKSSSDEREARLNNAEQMPTSRMASIKVYNRNPDVVASVLIRAKGVCEACGEDAPFIRRKDKTPYLEVHHIKKLADGGKDIVSNAIALCPNCHRKVHFGIQ